MEQHDIRWIQRYANYHKACSRLLAITESDRFMEDLSELEIEGLVQRFEYTYELAWKVLQDLAFISRMVPSLAHTVTATSAPSK